MGDKLLFFEDPCIINLNPSLLPSDGLPTVLHKVFVGEGEMAITEESVPCGQGGWMSGREYEVASGVDECSFLLGIGSPEDEDEVLALRSQEANDCVGKLFPPLPLVTPCLPGSYGKRGVEQ